MTLISGTIYQLTNHYKKCVYIGSTSLKNPKHRYYGHTSIGGTTERNHPDLFDRPDGRCNPDFTILYSGEFKNGDDIRTMEDNFIQSFKKMEHIKVCNINHASGKPYIREQLRVAKIKYKQSEKGKLAAKWCNYRYWKRKKILREIKDKVPLIH